jgi:hypothetical protein
MVNVDTTRTNGVAIAPLPGPSSPDQAPNPAAPPQTISEGSWLGRLVALFTPVFAVFAGWVAGVVAKHVPGAQLDPTQVTTFMVAAVTAALAAGLHWLHGWQQHERLVVENHATPRVVARTHNPRLPH